MFDWTTLLLSFAGGIAGAAFGALPIFILCGLAAIIGAALNIAGVAPGFMNNVTWGPFLGPQTSFAGGVAAAAYAARKKKLGSGRDIVSGLMGLDSPDALLIGGLFGALGYVLTWLLNLVPNVGGLPWTNTIALSIAINAILVRVIFGKTGIFGTVKEGMTRWMPTPEACWVPWQSQPNQLLIIGIAVAIPAAFSAQAIPTSVGLIFGFGVVSLIFLQYGTKIPVTHHIALCAELFASSTGNAGWGIAAGLLAVFLAEFFAALFQFHGDTHIDPPTMAIIVLFTLHPILKLSGLLALGGAIPFAVAAGVALLCYAALSILRSQPASATLPVPAINPE